MQRDCGAVVTTLGSGGDLGYFAGPTKDSSMEKIAVVTGAGSGVGRASAVRLVKEGWRVALVSRREDSLRETAKLCGAAEKTLAVPCDIADPAAVMKMAADVLDHFGQVDALVHAAGT